MELITQPTLVGEERMDVRSTLGRNRGRSSRVGMRRNFRVHDYCARVLHGQRALVAFLDCAGLRLLVHSGLVLRRGARPNVPADQTRTGAPAFTRLPA